MNSALLFTEKENESENQSFMTRKIRIVKPKLRYKRYIIVLIWAITFAYLSVAAQVSSYPSSSPSFDWKGDGPGGEKRLLQAGADGSNATEPLDFSDLNCTSPTIEDFPPDLFTQTQRQNGYIVVHFMASLYIFYTIAICCDDYFVPSIERICEDLKLPTDIAGATFMAIATSSPELFTNVIGTFITKGDIGVGTIVGSAVFNILAVGACCALAAKEALQLDWYPLTRDCIFYSLSVVLLIIVLSNRQVFWYEALVLVLLYIVYILAMWKNEQLKGAAESFVYWIRKKFGCKTKEKAQFGKIASRVEFMKNERSPLLG